MRALTAGSLAMVPLVPHRCCVRLVADHASRVSDGLFYNDQFGAHNIWEIDVDEALIDCLMYDGGLLRKRGDETEADVDNLLRLMESKVKVDLGLSIALTRKAI